VREIVVRACLRITIASTIAKVLVPVGRRYWRLPLAVSCLPALSGLARDRNWEVVRRASREFEKARHGNSCVSGHGFRSNVHLCLAFSRDGSNLDTDGRRSRFCGSSLWNLPHRNCCLRRAVIPHYVFAKLLALSSRPWLCVQQRQSESHMFLQ